MAVSDLLRNNPAVFLSVMGVLGLLVGSFLNVVIHRLPLMLEREWRREARSVLEPDAPEEAAEVFNLISPRSRCVHCGHGISALENIPVISYLALGGKCRECGQAIAIRYPVVEFVSAALTVFLAWHYGYGPHALLAVLFSWALLALSVIDLDHQLLPDDITLSFLWLGLGVNLFGVFTSLQSGVIGAIAGYGSLWLVYIIFKLATGKIGMGHGDFKLTAMLGAWCGWQMLPLIIILASFSGAVIGAVLILLNLHERSRPIPFGPFLALAGWIALLWGPELTGVYTRWAVHP